MPRAAPGRDLVDLEPLFQPAGVVDPPLAKGVAPRVGDLTARRQHYGLECGRYLDVFRLRTVAHTDQAHRHLPGIGHRVVRCQRHSAIGAVGDAQTVRVVNSAIPCPSFVYIGTVVPRCDLLLNGLPLGGAEAVRHLVRHTLWRGAFGRGGGDPASACKWGVLGNIHVGSDRKCAAGVALLRHWAANACTMNGLQCSVRLRPGRRIRLQDKKGRQDAGTQSCLPQHASERWVTGDQ